MACHSKRVLVIECDITEESYGTEVTTELVKHIPSYESTTDIDSTMFCTTGLGDVKGCMNERVR